MLWGWLPSSTRFKSRSTSTLVFPEPAAAETSSAPPSLSTTACWAAVRRMSAMVLLLSR